MRTVFSIIYYVVMAVSLICMHMGFKVLFVSYDKNDDESQKKQKASIVTFLFGAYLSTLAMFIYLFSL